VDLGLTDKTAIVTGGASNIGKAITEGLAAEGANVVIADVDANQAQTVVNKLQASASGTIMFVKTDVSDREQVEAMTSQALETFGQVDILVNNAADRARVPTLELSLAEWKRVINIILDGAFLCTRAVVPHMLENKWGRIINISGGNARNAGNLSGGARNVSLVHMTKTLATQIGKFGITVNCIHPGTTRTERTAVMMEARSKEMGITPEEVEAQDFTDGSPRTNHINRMVDASEIGYLTAYLASDKSWAVTGEVIMAGGGTGTAVYY